MQIGKVRELVGDMDRQMVGGWIVHENSGPKSCFGKICP